jgi:signal transduction histidine kinase
VAGRAAALDRRPARRRELTPIQQTANRIAALVHLGSFLIGGPLALLAGADPVWVLPAVLGYGLWSGAYARVALTRGLPHSMIAIDVLVTMALCLMVGRLVPIEVVQEGSSWVATITWLEVVTLPLLWRAWLSVPAGLAIVASFVGGFWIGGSPERDARIPGLVVVMLLISASVMVVVRRADARATRVWDAVTEARRVAAIEAARRADEGHQLRLLHDTALTTLTLVGTGGIGPSAHLADRASADLAVIAELAADAVPAGESPVRLDEALAAVVAETPPELSIAHELRPCSVPAGVADAFAGAVAEALRNVSRHAGVDAARLTLSTVDGWVCVEVADAGCGFELEETPAYRHGVRNSIVGRMAAVHARVRLVSGTGRGTLWRLEWREGRSSR